MLKISGSTESLTRLGKGRVGVSRDSRAARDENKLNGSEIDDDEIDGDKIDNKVGKKGRNPSTLSKSKKTELGFLIFGARMAIIKLRQAFIKAPILHHFNPERHIWVEMDVSSYVIGGVFS